MNYSCTFIIYYIVIDTTGHNGNPIAIHITNKIIHPIKNINECVTIVEVIVPIPSFYHIFEQTQLSLQNNSYVKIF